MPDLKRLEQHFFGTTTQAASVAEYPFVLIGRRHLRSNNSWLHNSKRLVKGKSRCTLMLHPDDATALGIVDQQPVQVRSRVGQVTILAEITDQLMQGVVSIPHGWGHDKTGTGWSIAEQHAGVSVNDLTDDRVLDTLSGNAVLNGIPVHLQPLALITESANASQLATTD